MKYLEFLYMVLVAFSAKRLFVSAQGFDSPTGWIDWIEGIEGIVDGSQEILDEILDYNEKPQPVKSPLLIPNPNGDIPAPGSDDRSTTESEQGAPTFECDTSEKPCQESIPSIVFPLGCRRNRGACSINAQNEATTAMLVRMVGSRKKILISRDDNDGVFLWALHLTRQQISEVKSAKDRVRAVIRDKPVQFDRLGNMPISDRPGETSENLFVKGRLKSRTEEKIAVQQDAPRHLCRISQAPNNQIQEQYRYFESAGQGITIYNLDSGASPRNQYVNIHRWIYGTDQYSIPADHFAGGGHGSCTSSLILGPLGVSKKANIVAVKTGLSMTSNILDSWQMIVNDIGRRERDGEPVRGYTVVSNQITIQDYDQELLIALQTKLRTLFNIHQTVIVSSAGNPGGSIQDIPSVLSTQQDFPIITVGAVDKYGMTLPTSSGGPALTVSAPGEVQCATSTPGDSTMEAGGTSASSALVAGLAANLLASGKYGEHLRQQDSIPTAVRDLIVDLAYVRQGSTDKVIWNGIH